MSSKEKINIVIVDDHDWVRYGLKLGLESEDIHCVGEADNGFDAVEICTRLNPDVVVMDMYMPRQGGVETIRQIMERAPGTKIIALSAFSDSPLIREALSAGAASFLGKTGSIGNLRDAIHAVHEAAYESE